MPEGYNQNLDLRREFATRVEAAPIAATSILNGMFMELLAGQAPFIVQRFHRAVYWGTANQLMDFTTIEIRRRRRPTTMRIRFTRWIRIDGYGGLTD